MVQFSGMLSLKKQRKYIQRELHAILPSTFQGIKTQQSFPDCYVCISYEDDGDCAWTRFQDKVAALHTCNHALKLFFPLPSCGSWGQKEWQRPSHIGRTCTSYGRRAPPGCGRWACPSSWRWRRTGHTWMSSHLWQRQVSVCKSHFQFIYCCASKHTVITRS